MTSYFSMLLMLMYVYAYVHDLVFHLNCTVVD